MTRAITQISKSSSHDEIDMNEIIWGKKKRMWILTISDISLCPLPATHFRAYITIRKSVQSTQRIATDPWLSWETSRLPWIKPRCRSEWQSITRLHTWWRRKESRIRCRKREGRRCTSGRLIFFVIKITLLLIHSVFYVINLDKTLLNA